MKYSSFELLTLLALKPQSSLPLRVSSFFRRLLLALAILHSAPGLAAQMPSHDGHDKAPGASDHDAHGNAAEAPYKSTRRHSPEVSAVQTYQQYCSVCHGDKGDGRSRASGSMRPPPRDFTSAKAEELSREHMIVAVRVGSEGTAMAPWGSQLSGAEIAALVDYIRSKFMGIHDNGDDAEDGAKIYARNCSVCHGDDGRGAVWASTSLRVRPRDFTSEQAATDLSRKRMIQSATYGRADTPMPGFTTQLSAQQIEAVVDFIRERFMTASAAMSADASAADGKDEHQEHGHGGDANAAGDGAGFPSALAGDLHRGEDLYRQNCVACHGLRGDGQGPRAYFIMPKPRDFTHPAARQTLNSRAHLFAAIAKGVVGTEMPAWDKGLDAQSIADVAEYVYQSFVHVSDASTANAKH